MFLWREHCSFFTGNTRERLEVEIWSFRRAIFAFFTVPEWFVTRTYSFEFRWNERDVVDNLLLNLGEWSSVRDEVRMVDISEVLFLRNLRGRDEWYYWWGDNRL